MGFFDFLLKLDIYTKLFLLAIFILILIRIDNAIKVARAEARERKTEKKRWQEKDRRKENVAQEQNRRKYEAEHGRRQTAYRRDIYQFNEGFTQEDFRREAQKAAKKLQRVEFIGTEGLKIYCRGTKTNLVDKWDFSVDFNDNGHYTGTYWIKNKNKDSNRPRSYGNVVREALDAYVEKNMPQDDDYDDEAYEDEDEEEDSYDFSFTSGQRKSKSGRFFGIIKFVFFGWLILMFIDLLIDL